MALGDKAECTDEDAVECVFFFFQAEDGIRDAQESRGLGDVYRGQVLGTRQTGDINFKLADLQRDQHLIPSIHEQAKSLITTHPILCSQLIQRWVGLSEQFAQA